MRSAERGVGALLGGSDPSENPVPDVDPDPDPEPDSFGSCAFACTEGENEPARDGAGVLPSAPE